MASRMKWPATVLIGCILVTAWARTVPPDGVTSSRTSDDQTRAFNANAAALIAADAEYRQFARADSLLPLLPASPGLTVALHPALPATARDTITRAAVAEMGAITRPRARVGVFLVDGAYGRREGVPFLPRSGERELYVGTDAAGAYCALVAGGTLNGGTLSTTGFRHVRDSRMRLHDRTVLGPCAFIARYGAPGPLISRWLDAGAYQLAELPATAFPRDWRPGRPFGLWTGSDVRMRGCVGGREDLCAQVTLGTGRSRGRRGPLAYDLGPVFFLADRTDRTMLGDMEAAFGTERFARFWSSDRDVEAAFDHAFGVSLGSWVMEWAEARFGEQKIGPALDALSLLLSALTVLGLGAIAAMVAARRSL
jgi:hypothetical protein